MIEDFVQRVFTETDEEKLLKEKEIMERIEFQFPAPGIKLRISLIARRIEDIIKKPR